MIWVYMDEICVGATRKGRYLRNLPLVSRK
jgi:hypothetical protein